MTPQQAKTVLLAYRPNCGHEKDPEVAEALALAHDDNDLRGWLQSHVAAQEALRSKLLELQPGADLKMALLKRNKIIGLTPWWHRSEAWAIAAAIVLLLGIAVLWRPFRPPENLFSEYKTRMVATVLREYRMDVESSEMAQVRAYMASRGAPDDYELRSGMKDLTLAGGGFLKWRNQPVSMVCFRKPDNTMVYLFVVKTEAVKNPPSATPQLAPVHETPTASWTKDGYTYVLTGPPGGGFPEKYL